MTSTKIFDPQNSPIASLSNLKILKQSWILTLLSIQLNSRIDLIAIKYKPFDYYKLMKENLEF